MSNSPRAKYALPGEKDPESSDEEQAALGFTHLELSDVDDTGQAGPIISSSPEVAGLLGSDSEDDTTKGSPACMMKNLGSNAGAVPAQAEDVLLSFADFDAHCPTVLPPMLPLEESPPEEPVVEETTYDGANDSAGQQQQQQPTIQPLSAVLDGAEADVNAKQQQLEQQLCHPFEQVETQGSSKELGPPQDAEAEHMAEPDPEMPAEQDACGARSAVTQEATKVLSAAVPPQSPSPGSCLGGCWQLLLPRSKAQQLPLLAR